MYSVELDEDLKMSKFIGSAEYVKTSNVMHQITIVSACLAFLR